MVLLDGTQCFPITETIVGALVPKYWEFSSVLGSSAIFKDRQIVHATGISKTNTLVAANSPFDVSSQKASPARSNQRTSYRTTQCAMEKCCDTCVCGSTAGKYGLAWQPENVQPPNVQSRRVLQQRTVSDRFSWRLTQWLVDTDRYLAYEPPYFSGMNLPWQANCDKWNAL
ncbi:uncharacterized protein LOC120906539 [Anopheles arabiensis]|uniref:uncharacterized protein LOC120906539 n=1 Tax=Anopheles arabiensis TaxID=7173 RepID=UPI001AADEB00|nr:uncharacterized protein LOC120906539 [Anopheles arabiensis]